MDKNKETLINTNMEDVISTTKRVRDFLLDENISLEEKKDHLKVIKTTIDANKNIVSAACVLINVEQILK